MLSNKQYLYSETDMDSLPYPFSESKLGIKLTIDEFSTSLSSLKNWTERYRQLFKLADFIIPLEDKWRIDDYLVEGCENPVWLIYQYDKEQQKHYFMADSDSKIIKGLLTLILSACNGQQTKTIQGFDLESTINNLDFGKYLTPSRTNGLLAVMAEIRDYCGIN